MIAHFSLKMSWNIDEPSVHSLGVKTLVQDSIAALPVSLSRRVF